MTQRQITHAPGTLPRCSRCERDPKHFEDRRAVRCGGGHTLECCACGMKTGRAANLELALVEWRQLHGYAPQPRAIAGRVSTFPARQVRS